MVLAMLTVVMPLSASVLVHQVESYYQSSTAYATVNFNGNLTVLGTGNWAGITFHGQSGLINTYSQHAADVGYRFYNAVGAPEGYVAITDVYADAYNYFLNNQVKTNGTLGIGDVPGFFGGSASPLGIKVSNHAWVYTYVPSNPTKPDIDEEAIRRIDFMINRENVVLVAGAVAQSSNPSGNFYNTNLLWAARNSLAVRGAHVDTPFSPATSGPGKRHADLWTSELASYATGRVSGYAASLIDHAQSLGQTDSNFNAAANTQVIRSLMMTGANKSIIEAPLLPWTRDTVNNLDIDLGAGKVDYILSKSILEAGRKQSFTVSSGNIVNPVIYETGQGWVYETSLVGADKAVVFATSTTLTSLTATLNWNVTQTQPNSTKINTSNAAMIFANLDLDLVPLTRISQSTFALGTPLSQTGLTSHATSDNVEHLYYTGNDLAAGFYALVVRGDPSLTVNYGLSFNLSNVTSFSYLLGDMNLDGVVNNQDITAFVLALTDPNAYAVMYPTANLLQVGDINGDLSFDNQDINPFVTLLTGSGMSLSGSELNSLGVIPEPASLLLISIGSMLMLSRRRR